MSKRFGETFEELYSMKEQMDKLFRTSLGRVGTKEHAPQGQWCPPVDMYDNGVDYILEVELPGIKQEDLDVSIMPDYIRIKGRKTFLQTIDQEKIHRLERPSGVFDRRLSFPVKVDPEKAVATLENGVLSIRIPKIEAPSKIAIQIQKA
ncbi:MAG: Hsp20/alpha crystallin family protein [Deltaproteobacteria bacterium]|nr:Hsp20/alpha crystallin family protein [Candidatus Anaeroferrophillus wilburensis]MBN2888735.1 Hsp20/alpha crystallin family protein [Deltaproteobacteria bacterium]